MPLRRVVTGHDSEGRSRIVIDDTVEPITSDLVPGFAAYRLWARDEPPAFPDDGSPDRVETWFPPRAGSRFIVVTHPPEGASPSPDVDVAAAAAELERQMPGVTAVTDPDGSGMHTTDTMDYVMVVQGEATLELDDGERTVLRAGDVVVQNGTHHVWRNYGTEPCTIVAVAVGADRTTQPSDVDDLGGRLPLLDPTALSPAQQTFHDAAMTEEYPWSLDVGFRFTTDDRRLIGPHNAFLRRPEVFERFREFAKATSRHTSLSPQLREVVILAVGSARHSDYEVYAHRRVALAAGISEADVDAMAAGHAPSQLGREAEVLFGLVRQLTREHHVAQPRYDEALAIFGEQGLVDVAALTGAYLTVSSVLDLFGVPAPR